MRRATAVLIATALVTAGIGLGACGSGSDSDSGSTTETTLDRATLGAKADAICRRLFAKQVALLGSISVTDPASMTRAMTKVHALWEATADDVAALTPDAQTKAQWEAFLATVRKEAALYGQSEAAIRAGDAIKNAQLLTPLQANTKAFTAAAADVGATACASPTG